MILHMKNIFKKQLENLLEKNDIVIGISGSGNSVNVLNAIKFANNENAVTISLYWKSRRQNIKKLTS